MAKKRKSIYDKPLKDINKDGKVNFGDTWLGDALGFDGKMGIQKGRPGLRASLKGARRGKTETKKEDKPKRPRSRPSGSTSTRSGVVGASGTGPGPTQGGAGGPASKRSTDSGMDDKAAATRRAITGSKSSSKTASMQDMKNRMDATQKNTFNLLSPAQRRQILNNYKTTGKIDFSASTSTFQERRKEAKKQIQAEKKEASAIKSVSPKVINQWSRSPEGIRWIQNNKGASEEDRKKAAMRWQAKQSSGMAKGGMARYKKSGNTNYKGKGMFYDSKSPRGYK